MMKPTTRHDYEFTLRSALHDPITPIRPHLTGIALKVVSCSIRTDRRFAV